MPSPPPQNEPLCEHCGYAITDIDLDSSCPECGVSIASSLPAARTGLWFQNHHPPHRGWRTTVADVILSPRRSFRHVRIDAPGSRRFLITSLAVNALLWAAGLAVTTILHESGRGSFEILFYCIVAVVVALPFMAFGIFSLTYILTLIEGWGVRLATRRRGWRITRDVSRTVCAFASCGWILGGVTYLLFVIFIFLWNALVHPNEPSRFQSQPFWIALTLAAIAGMLAFETLVYLGIRQCRYANAPAPTAPALETPALPPS